MSNSSYIVRTIAKKEMIEFVRDWRTLLAIILIPLLLFPVLFILLPLVLASEAAELDVQLVDVVVQGDSDEELDELLCTEYVSCTYEELPVSSDNFSDVEPDVERLRNNSVDAILRLKNNTNGTWNFAILDLSTSEHSREASGRILVAISTWEKSLVNQTLLAHNLDPNATLDPVRLLGDSSLSDAATEGEQIGLVLSLFIPLVLSIWTATSAVQPSIDMTAGERERGTLEALLSLPCKRMDLLMGKWLAVAIIAGVSVVLQILGLFFAIAFLASSNVIGIPAIELQAMLLMAFAIGLFAIMIVAFELALAIRSRSVKEAGTILGPLMLVIIFPAIFVQLINLDGIEIWWFGVPLVNILLALRELLLNRVIFSHVLVWFISSSFYSICAAWYAARQFNREDLVESLN